MDSVLSPFKVAFADDSSTQAPLSLAPNPTKKLSCDLDIGRFMRIPIRTSVVTRADHLESLLDTYVLSHLIPGDIVVISEKVVAITQGRGFPISEIRPTRLAFFLCRFVYKSPYGIGLGSPWTMELALKEAGVLRVIFAAAIACIGKIVGIKGLFYQICGRGVAAIDGPCSYTLPPYNEWAILGPKNAPAVAKQLSQHLNTGVAIVDINDLGAAILGSYATHLSKKDLCEILHDNPLGQSKEQTPIGIIRRADSNEVLIDEER